MKRKKGSITIFSLLSLLLVTAAIFALLEGTRLQEMRRFANLQTKSALESVFAVYNNCLWQNYHLLGTDKENLEDLLEEMANGRQGAEKNFLRFVPQEVETISYSRMTDGNGDMFIRCVSTYMEDNILYEAIKEIHSQYESIKQILDANEMDISNITGALDEIEKLEEEKAKKSVGSSARKTEKGSGVKGILEAAEEWRQMGILELLVKDTSKLSKAKIDLENGLINRRLLKGTAEVSGTTDWVDRILFQQYLLSYMSHLQDVKEGRALSYELEYLLGEKSSDIENLQVVATELLAIRQATNFLFLLSNPVKVTQALGFATLIGGATVNPIVIQIIKVALLTAWAFAESILDVRALLAGKKIALIKSEENWTLELANIGVITSDYMMAKESVVGLNYESYLGILLLLKNEKKLAMHAMNVQEATIRKIYQDESFGMDKLITAASVKVHYIYEPIFPFLRVIDAEERWEYKITGMEDYSYY